MTFVPGFLPSTSALHFSNAWPNLPLLTVQTPFGPVNIGNTALGVCGGMCYVARDLFEARALPPDATSAPSSTDDPVYQYTVARFFDSLTPGAIATYYALMDPALPDHETELSQIGLAPHGRSWIMVNQSWPKIKADIDSGHPSPIGLVLTKSLNPGDLGLNHVVVVYGYDLVGTDLTLHIYDPNFANNNSQTIRLNIGHPMGGHHCYEQSRESELLFPSGRLHGGAALATCRMRQPNCSAFPRAGRAQLPGKHHHEKYGNHHLDVRRLQSAASGFAKPAGQHSLGVEQGECAEAGCSR
jgi:hypothetical protein